AGTGNELYIYNFNGSILSLGTSVGFTAAVNCVRWHPSQNYFAFGPSAAITGNELRIYSWDGTTLTQTGGISFATGVASVSWSKDGNYLSAATTTMLYVYSFSAGVITLVTSISFSGSGTASVSALDWSTDGSYIVLGTNGVGSSLNVYSFNGSTLSLNSSISGISVRSVSWKQNENLIAVGLDGSTENLRIYEHASGLLSEKIASRIGLTATCYAARWINGSDYLVLGLATGLGYEFGTLYVSPASYKIYPVVIFSTGTTVLDAMPSNNGQYLLNAMGSSINLYRINGSDLYFYDTSLILNSDSVISQNFNMYGNCKIDARGNILDLQTGQIQVGENSNLKIKNAKISGLYSTRLKNIANSSSITLQNCEMDLYGDYTFDAGSLLIKSDVVISGTNALNYTSRFTCSIDKNSSLSINNGAKFNYAPSAARNNLIYMYDKSSVLYLNNCTFSTTTTGILLTNGTLILDNNVSLSCAGLASSESIKFGSGVVTHDLNVILDSALNLNIYGGFEYNNVS
ncbi:hypothetical protein KKE07_05055, partial [Candidatus Dependentiae bacterium]|nr:hypothetical protein [Candidatus Dependentiae bacterium]